MTVFPRIGDIYIKHIINLYYVHCGDNFGYERTKFPTASCFGAARKCFKLQQMNGEVQVKPQSSGVTISSDPCCGTAISIALMVSTKLVPLFAESEKPPIKGVASSTENDVHQKMMEACHSLRMAASMSLSDL